MTYSELDSDKQKFIDDKNFLEVWEYVKNNKINEKVYLKDDYEGNQIFKNVKNTKEFYIQLSALHGDKLNNVDVKHLILSKNKEI